MIWLILGAMLASAIAGWIGWILRAPRTYVRRVSGDVDPWIVDYVAECTVRRLQNAARSNAEREVLERLVRSLTVIGVERPFVPTSPWELGATSAAMISDTVWILGRRDQLEERLARLLGQVTLKALYQGYLTPEREAAWIKLAVEPWEKIEPKVNPQLKKPEGLLAQAS